MYIGRKNDPSRMRLFIGTNRHVVCLDRSTGRTLWEKRITNSLDRRTLVLPIGDRVYAACSEAAVALDIERGDILWTTPINTPMPTYLAFDPATSGGLFYVVCHGAVTALSIENGAVMWRNDLPGLGFHSISLGLPGALIASQDPFEF